MELSCCSRLEFPRMGCDSRRPRAAKLRQCHWCGDHTHRNPRDLHLGRAEFLFWVPLSIIGSTHLEIELKEHSERLHLELKFTATREGRLAMFYELSHNTLLASVAPVAGSFISEQ